MLGKGILISRLYICTKYGFCEEVYKLMEATNLNQIIANLLSINDYLSNVQNSCPFLSN
jgi:hypothetical protein